MSRFLPRTMAAQTIVVLLVGLSVSLIVSMLIYSGDRIGALTMMGGQNMAQRIANVTHLIGESPVEWRQRIIKGISGDGFRVWITPESQLSDDLHDWQGKAVKDYIKSRQPGLEDGDIRVHILDDVSSDIMTHMPGNMGRMHQRMMEVMHGVPAHQAMRVSIKLGDGSWLNFSSVIPEVSSLWSTTSLLSLTAMAITVVLLSIWVVRRLSRPLSTFAEASKRLGRDVNTPPLDEVGPLEVKEATRAFNEMQAQIKRLLDNRTQLLAAISHDLRTPLTLMRLRLEAMEDSDDRTKMLGTLSDMEHMIASTLAFARADAQEEERRTVDVSALVSSLADDMSDMGYELAFDPPGKVLLDCRPLAIKRAISNLLENAVKYGGKARLTLTATKKEVTLDIDDSGPGIPEDALEKVFQPFFRCENSRNHNTGGVGLGLSIAQSIAHAHGGEIQLENLTRGLRARLILPV